MMNYTEGFLSKDQLVEWFLLRDLNKDSKLCNVIIASILITDVKAHTVANCKTSS